MKLNLNDNQSLRAGICFVNMLGISVKDEELINNGDTLAYPLYNEDKTIGYISIQNQKVRIRAKNEEFELLGYYDIPNANGMEDAESGISGIVYADWNNSIECAIRTKDGMEIRGDIILSCSADKEFGSKCSIHSDINVTNSLLGNFNLKFNNKGYNFRYSNKNDKFEENIDISFLQDLIAHTIRSDFDENGKWHSRKIAGASTAYYNGTKRVRWYRNTQKVINGNIEDIYVLEDNQDLMGSYGDIIQSIQLGNAAQFVAPKMFERIQQIRDILKINNIYLFDYLVNAMFNNEELTKATFGYIPENICYQNGETKLKNAYFGDFSQNKNLLNK